MALDIKDIKEAVSDLLQENNGALEKKFNEDRKATETKYSEAIDKVLADSKAAAAEAAKKQSEEQAEGIKSAMQDQFDAFATKYAKEGKQSKGLSFKDAVSEALKEKHAELVANAQNEKKSQVIELKDFNFTDFANNADFRTDFTGAPILNPYESFHYRNIVPNATTDKGFLSFPKEQTTAGAADTWEHGGDSATAKPQINPAFDAYTVKVNWIAGLIKGIPVDMLEDLAWMTSYLQSKGMNELMKAEDLQIQNGTGTGADLDGFFNGSNAVAYDGAKTAFVEKLIDAAYRQVANNNYNANTVVVSNADKVNMLLFEKSTGAGYGLPAGSVQVVNGTLSMAGLRVFSNSYLAADQALIGDFNQSAFALRSAPRLRFFDQNADDAEKNQVTVRIEERAALAIYSNGAFVKLEPST